MIKMEDTQPSRSLHLRTRKRKSIKIGRNINDIKGPVYPLEYYQDWRVFYQGL